MPVEPQKRIETPAPTPWPMVTAFGVTLLCAGLVTHVVVSVVGFILAFRSAIGWFRLDALPTPLSLVTQYNVRDYQKKYGS